MGRLIALKLQEWEQKSTNTWYVKTMKYKLLLFVSCLFVLSGCSFGPKTVVGSWKLADPGDPGNSVNYVFNQNGTYTFTEHAAFDSVHTHQYADGVYTVSGRRLIITTIHETMGIDAKDIAAIDAREAALDPSLHIQQDKGDVPVKIEQPITTFLITYEGDKLKLKDLGNYADHGVLYVHS